MQSLGGSVRGLQLLDEDLLPEDDFGQLRVGGGELPQLLAGHSGSSWRKVDCKSSVYYLFKATQAPEKFRPL